MRSEVKVTVMTRKNNARKIQKFFFVNSQTVWLSALWSTKTLFLFFFMIKFKQNPIIVITALMIKQIK